MSQFANRLILFIHSTTFHLVAKTNKIVAVVAPYPNRLPGHY